MDDPRGFRPHTDTNLTSCAMTTGRQLPYCHVKCCSYLLKVKVLYCKMPISNQ